VRGVQRPFKDCRATEEEDIIGLHVRAMAQAVSRLPLNAEARVRALSVHVGFVVGKEALGQVCLLVLRLCPVNNISPWLSVVMYHVGGRQWARLWPQFKDRPHRFNMNIICLHKKILVFFSCFSILRTV
jgi:hypothetical protein